MLKFLSILLAAAVLAAPAYARRKKAPVLEDNKAYVLYLQGCPICQNALEYINERYLTRPDVVRVDLETEEGRSLLKQCAKNLVSKALSLRLSASATSISWGGRPKQPAILTSIWWNCTADCVAGGLHQPAAAGQNWLDCTADSVADGICQTFRLIICETSV